MARNSTGHRRKPLCSPLDPNIELSQRRDKSSLPGRGDGEIVPGSCRRGRRSPGETFLTRKKEVPLILHPQIKEQDVAEVPCRSGCPRYLEKMISGHPADGNASAPGASRTLF